MSVIELRREFRKLQEEFMGGALSKLKKHEVEHRMAALKSAMAIKADTPAPTPAHAGAPGAREVKSKEVLIDDETKLIKPVAPKGGMKHATSYKKGGAKKEDAAKKPDVSDVSTSADTVAHVVDKAPTAPAAASAAEKPKKPRRVPPKVEFTDDAPAAAPVETAAKPERKVVKKPVAKKEAAPKKAASKATAEPNTEKPAPEPVTPEPVAAPKIKLPGGCRPLPGAEVSFG
jgi:hypothetical protein